MVQYPDNFMSKLLPLLNKPEPLLMGILNTTPDSFSDGGRYTSVDAALAQAERMIAEGAAIIDVGGESTRPGAQPVSEPDEIERVVPVIEAIHQAFPDTVISIDTSKPAVMRAAVEAGAELVNDVNALRADGAVETCARLGVVVCLMHMQGEPRTMQQHPVYADVVAEVADFLAQRKQVCIEQGIDQARILLDPGFGFGKSLTHNLQLLKHLTELHSLQQPLLVGISRKSMLGAVLDGAPVDERLYASVAALVLAWERGAKIFRVHDVAASRDALNVCEAMRQVEELANNRHNN